MEKYLEIEEASYRKKPLAPFEVGDTIDVKVSIKEGEKERVQTFTGICIARRGRGTSETFTVRRIVQGEGVERVFPVHSPKIVDVEVRSKAVVRRAKLYYLRDRVGKATRLKERIVRGDNQKQGD